MSTAMSIRLVSLGVKSERIVLRGATLAEIFPLRYAELRPGLPIESAQFEADEDPGTRHFGAFVANGANLIGCASFMPSVWQGDAAFQLRGMATRSDLVHRGIGRALLQFAQGALREEFALRPLWCNARVGAVGFYERLGWTVVSDVFDVPTVGPHRTMLRR